MKNLPPRPKINTINNDSNINTFSKNQHYEVKLRIPINNNNNLNNNPRIINNFSVSKEILPSINNNISLTNINNINMNKSFSSSKRKENPKLMKNHPILKSLFQK